MIKVRSKKRLKGAKIITLCVEVLLFFSFLVFIKGSWMFEIKIITVSSGNDNICRNKVCDNNSTKEEKELVWGFICKAPLHSCDVNTFCKEKE